MTQNDSDFAAGNALRGSSRGLVAIQQTREEEKKIGMKSLK